MTIRNDDSLNERKPDSAPDKNSEGQNPEGAGFTGGTQEKKRPLPESAQERSDTGTGL